jgi:uncharacterized protein (DUF1800 family)
MYRHFVLSKPIFALTTLIALAATPCAAAQPTFAISDVPASSVAARGRDAGVDVSKSTFVRISASGTLSTRYGACGKYYTPSGCYGTQGLLMGAFADARGTIDSGWYKIGTFADLAVPTGASRLLLRIEGISGREVGAYHVVTDAVTSPTVPIIGSGASGAGAVIRMMGARRVYSATSAATAGGSTSTSLGSGPEAAVGPNAAPTRSDLQYMMRRFGFSDSPAQVSYWFTHGGPSAWLTYQLNYTAIPDAAISSYVETMPTLTGNTSIYPDNEQQSIVETRLLQQETATQRQLLEKVTLHWLEHFAVSKYLVGSNADMEHYVDTVRADALGNFAKLVSDVAKEPAMLEWLDNNYNTGNDPLNPPNQNFGREVMQLYTIGLTQLNLDGTPVLDGSGNPVPTYTQSDVVTSSEALTGFEQHGPSTQTGSYPSYLDTVQFNPGNHYNPAMHGGAPLPTIFGQTISDPGGAQCAWNGTLPPGQAASGPCVVDNFVHILATQPTTCAFEANEMIQRFATETPSPGYVSRVASVWCNNLNASNQIALVVKAIATDPEFPGTKYTTVKEPIELLVDTIRALRGSNNAVSANPIVSQHIPLGGPLGDSSNMQQEVWYPPSVFSFYYPGHKEDLLDNYEILSRWQTASDLSNDVFITPPATQPDTALDLTALAPAGMTATTSEVNRAVGYVLDALVDGGTSELKAIATNYMMNYTNNQSTTASNSFARGIKGVVWIVMSSPEDEAN